MPVYLKLDKIKGLSRAKGYEGWIELLSLHVNVRRGKPEDAPPAHSLLQFWSGVWALRVCMLAPC